MDEIQTEKSYNYIKDQYLKLKTYQTVFLRQYHHILIEAKKFDEVPEVATELLHLIENHLKANGYDVYQFAQQKNGDKQIHDALLFLRISCIFYKRVSNMAGMVNCAKELFKTIKMMAKDGKHQEVVTGYAVPLLTSICEFVKAGNREGLQSACEKLLRGCQRHLSEKKKDLFITTNEKNYSLRY